MGKPRKATSSRKPPVPSDSHAVIEDWMRGVRDRTRPLRQTEDPGRSAGARSAQMDRASGPRAGLEMRES